MCILFRVRPWYIGFAYLVQFSPACLVILAGGSFSFDTSLTSLAKCFHGQRIGCLTGKILFTQRLKARNCSDQDLFIYLYVCVRVCPDSLFWADHSQDRLFCWCTSSWSRIQRLVSNKTLNKLSKYLKSFTNNEPCDYYHQLNMWKLLNHSHVMILGSVWGVLIHTQTLVLWVESGNIGSLKLIVWSYRRLR